MARVNTVLSPTYTFIHKWNEPYLPYLVASRRTSPHFGRYSFSIPLRVEGWVGLSGWLQTEVVDPPADGLSLKPPAPLNPLQDFKALYKYYKYCIIIIIIIIIITKVPSVVAPAEQK